MKNLIVLFALTSLSNGALAGGFQPWEERPANDLPAAFSDAVFDLQTGFAPWRDRQIQVQETRGAIEFVDRGTSAFRPWS